MPNYRRLALRLFVIGGAIALVSVVGLVAGVGETTKPTAAGEGTTTTTPIRTGGGSETPLEFVAALAKAEQDANVDFRFERLHPAVIDRYSADECRAAVDDPADPAARFENPQIDHVGSWEYASDGKTTTIPNTTFVNAKRYSAAQSGEQVVLHIAKSGGKWRWFTACSS